jgi:hypothetical protein
MNGLHSEIFNYVWMSKGFTVNITLLRKQCLLFISTETATDKGCTITPLDRASLQLQNTIFPHSHRHWLCSFASDEQEPACWSLKNLHQRRRPTFSQLRRRRRCQENGAR